MAQVIETVFSIRTEESIANLNEVVGALGRTEAAGKKAAKGVSDEMGKIPKATKKAASGFNGLSNSINQVSRELPAFAFSAQTGFLAISNNIPILIDEITALRKANAALTASGKESVSVFKQVVSSLFSWQTALSIGISLSVLYAKEIGNFFKELFKGKEAFNAAKISLEALNKAYNSEQLKSGVQSLFEMRVNLGAARQGYIDKKATLEEYNKTYGVTFGIAKSIGEAEKDLINGTPAYISALVQRGAAQELINQASADLLARDKAIRDRIAVQAKLDKANADARKSQSTGTILGGGTVGTSSQQGGGLAIILELERKKKALGQEIIDFDNAQKKKLELAQAYADRAAKFLKLGLDDAGKPDEDKNKAKTAEELLQESLDAELNAAKATYVKILETKVRTDEEKEKADLDYLDAQIAIYEKFVKVDKKYLDDLLDLRKQKAEEQIKISQAALEKEYKADKQFMEDTFDAELNNITEKYTAIRGGREKTRLESLKIDLLEIQDKIAFYDSKKEADKKYSDKLIESKKAEEKILTAIANEGDKEREALNRKTQKEIQDATLQLASSTFNALFQRDRENANMRTDAELYEIEKLKENKLISEEEFQKRKSAILNKNAETQRQIDLAQITINTSIAIMKALAQGSPVLAALALIEGGIQYAIASSQPLPKFAKGTDRVKGGIAGQDSVHALLMPNEAVIPAKANMERQGLAKAWIGGDLDKHLAMNYINPAINEVNRKWETSLKLNQQSTFIRNDNFSDRKIVGELIKSNRINKYIANSLNDKSVKSKHRRLWN